MVFVNKLLEQMLQEIGPRGPDAQLSVRREDDIRGFSEYLNMNRELLADKLDKADADALLHDPDYPGREWLGVVDFLVENGLYRAYKKIGKVTIDYTFGAKGVVVQVVDKGVGFDPKPIVEAAQNNVLQKGVHYRRNGWAFRAMQRPEFEAMVESAKGKGTTVTVLYKYKK